MNRLVFSDLNLPQIDCEKLVYELQRLPEKVWQFEPYRNTFIAPMLTRIGVLEGREVLNVKCDADFIWTRHAPQILKDYCQKFIFNWIKPVPRIMILRTFPGVANHEHIDCTRAVFGRPHYKFRYVLQGNVSDLYFMTKEKNFYAPEVDRPFIMDGGWPHGMQNSSEKIKYTLCVGAPWDGKCDSSLLGRVSLTLDECKIPQLNEKFFEVSY